VALDRAGERHPLQKVLAELKRYHGEIGVDLDRARETEGKRFVDAMLATEPNRLGEEFRQVLFQRTRGHPLFTLELLRDMQERGALVQDQQGRWLEGPLLDWNELPDRVEGIIEERIGRLEATLRDVLSVASVEGQDFTAQVLARVEQIRERDLLRVLSQELEKRHRLVREQGEVRLGQQFLARYQFAHALFQQYLYNQLGAGERRMLHGEIAALLEELYQGHTEGIAVQLARHYTEAGDDENAAHYLLQAGDAAARLYADAEARMHYTRALDALTRLPDTIENRRRRVDTLIKRVRSGMNSDSPEENLAHLAQAERLLGELRPPSGMQDQDRMLLARVYHSFGWIYFIGNAMPEAVSHFSRVLPYAQEIGDLDLVALPSAAIGLSLLLQGKLARAESLLRQAMAAFEQTGNQAEWVRAVAFHGAAIAIMGDYEPGMAELLPALARAQELGQPLLAWQVQGLLAWVLLIAGDPLQAMVFLHGAIKTAEEAGHRLAVSVGHGFEAWAEARAGRFGAAEASMARSQELARKSGGQLYFEDWLAVVQVDIALGAGRIQEAQELAERAVVIAQEMDSLAGKGLAQAAWGQVLAKLQPPRWDEAESRFAEGLRLIESMPSPPMAARTHLVWGTICRDRGDLTAAREHWQQAATLWEASGITWELEKVRALIATLPEA
jgi:tetratricopeptide (TPR) repeat protein